MQAPTSLSRHSSVKSSTSIDSQSIHNNQTTNKCNRDYNMNSESSITNFNLFHDNTLNNGNNNYNNDNNNNGNNSNNLNHNSNFNNKFLNTKNIVENNNTNNIIHSNNHSIINNIDNFDNRVNRPLATAATSSSAHTQYRNANAQQIEKRELFIPEFMKINENNLHYIAYTVIKSLLPSLKQSDICRVRFAFPKKLI